MKTLLTLIALLSAVPSFAQPNQQNVYAVKCNGNDSFVYFQEFNDYAVATAFQLNSQDPVERDHYLQDVLYYDIPNLLPLQLNQNRQFSGSIVAWTTIDAKRGNIYDPLPATSAITIFQKPSKTSKIHMDISTKWNWSQNLSESTHLDCIGI